MHNSVRNSVHNSVHNSVRNSVYNSVEQHGYNRVGRTELSQKVQLGWEQLG